MVTTRGARREPPCTDCVRKLDAEENRGRNIWVLLNPSCRVPVGRKKNGLRARFSAHPQPAPQCVGEAHWSVGRRRLGRPARPQTEERGVLWGGAVAATRKVMPAHSFTVFQQGLAAVSAATVLLPLMRLPAHSQSFDDSARQSVGIDGDDDT